MEFLECKWSLSSEFQTEKVRFLVEVRESQGISQTEKHVFFSVFSAKLVRLVSRLTTFSGSLMESIFLGRGGQLGQSPIVMEFT